MNIYTNLISGVSLGFELYEDEFGKGFVIDLLIVRIAFLKDHA